jgi:hypothetical protein
VQTYETAFLTVTTTGPLVAVTLIATSRPLSLLEFGMAVKTNTTAGTVVLGTPGATGTGSAGTALQALDPSDPAPSAALVNGAFATTQPTAPAVGFRQWNWSSSGPGIAWGWEPGELTVPTAGQLVLWVTTGAVQFSGYVKVAEGG